MLAMDGLRGRGWVVLVLPEIAGGLVIEGEVREWHRSRSRARERDHILVVLITKRLLTQILVLLVM